MTWNKRGQATLEVCLVSGIFVLLAVASFCLVALSASYFSLDHLTYEAMICAQASKDPHRCKKDLQRSSGLLALISDLQIELSQTRAKVSGTYFLPVSVNDPGFAIEHRLPKGWERK